MRRFWLIMCMMTCSFMAHATDFVFLENLITNHIKVSDLLASRVVVDAASVIEYKEVHNSTDEYEEVREDMNGRYGFKLLDAVGLGVQAYQIVNQANDVIDLTGRAIDASFDVCDKFPDIIDLAIYIQSRNGDKIADIYKIIMQVVTSGVKVSLATNEQKFMFLEAIRNNLTWMEESNKQLYAFAKSLEFYEPEEETMDYTSLFKKIEEKAYENAVKKAEKIFKVLE